MTNPKTNEHMSELNLKGSNLPPLQKLIVLHLAKSKPQTINETVTALSKSYKPTWLAFKSLEKKKLIRKTDVKNYRGREYPLFWLTDEGMIAAMLEGANQPFLLETTKTLFPDEKIVHCFLEVIQHMNPMMITLAGNVVKNKGTLDFVDFMKILVSDATFEIDVETMESIVSVLKKYPEEYEQAKMLIKMMIKQLNQLISE